MSGESGIRRFGAGLRYGSRLTAAVRILLGILFVLSGILKMIDIEAFGAAIAMYDILPSDLVPYAAVFVPALELVIGLCCAIGWRTRAASLLGLLLMIAFTLFVAVNVARGRRFDCGCFRTEALGFSIEQDVGPGAVARNVVLTAGFALVFAAKRHLASLEHTVEKMRLKYLKKARYE